MVMCRLMQQCRCKVAASNALQQGIELHSYCLHLFTPLLWAEQDACSPETIRWCKMQSDSPEQPPQQCDLQAIVLPGNSIEGCITADTTMWCRLDRTCSLVHVDYFCVCTSMYAKDHSAANTCT